MMRKQSFTLLVLATTLALSGCGKKEAPAPPPPPASPSGSVDSLLNGQPGGAPPPPATAAPAPPTPAAPAGAESEAPAAYNTDKAVADFNANLGNYINSHDYMPTNVADLKRIQSFRGIPPLPTPPPGKELVYVPNPNNPRASHIEFR